MKVIPGENTCLVGVSLVQISPTEFNTVTAFLIRLKNGWYRKQILQEPLQKLLSSCLYLTQKLDCIFSKYNRSQSKTLDPRQASSTVVKSMLDFADVTKNSQPRVQKKIQLPFHLHHKLLHFLDHRFLTFPLVVLSIFRSGALWRNEHVLDSESKQNFRTEQVSTIFAVQIAVPNFHYLNNVVFASRVIVKCPKPDPTMYFLRETDGTDSCLLFYIKATKVKAVLQVLGSILKTAAVCLQSTLMPFDVTHGC